MAKTKDSSTPEINAIGSVYEALKDLKAPVATRVLRYVAEMLELDIQSFKPSDEGMNGDTQDQASIVEPPSETSSREDTAADKFEGISSVASKWMRRSGLSAEKLQAIFSLDLEEIDLVTKEVSGKTVMDRMHNVALLKGIAAYLATGVPRVTHAQLKEACLHYKAYDGTNFAAYLRRLAADLSGSKNAGYTLTARGLTAATELLKSMAEK